MTQKQMPMQKLAKAFYELFHGRRDTYAVQRQKKDGSICYYRVTGKEATPETFDLHLSGDEIIGIYPLLPGNKCLCAAVDIDSSDVKLALRVQELLPKPNYLERSRSGNHHVWMFFENETDVRSLAEQCQEGVNLVKQQGCHGGLYPLPSKGIGLLIALPFQGNLVNQGLSTFLDEKGEPVTEIYSFLEGVKRCTQLTARATIAELFLGKGKRTGDTSRSGYDFTLLQQLRKRGFNAELAKEILLSKPSEQIHSTKDDYVKRTFKSTQEIKREEEVPTRSWDDLEPLNREQFFAKLAEEGKMVLGANQRQHLDIFYAALVANLKTGGRPIWLLIVGPPGCGKTLPMIAIQYSPFTYSCSSFRPAALISGWGIKGGHDMSLIPKLEGKILLVKDMSSLLSQNRDVVLEVLGLLRDAYDGSCARPFGTGVERRYKTRFGFIGAATPDIDTHWNLYVRLGERFLRLRVGSTLEQVYGKIDKSLASLMDEDRTDAELEEISLGYLKYLVRPGDLPALSSQKEIGRLAQLGAILRTAVARGQFSRQVLTLPEWEEATRYAKQLAKVAISLAYIREKDTNGDEEMEDLKTLIRGGMDMKMERLCGIICHNPGSTTAELGAKLGMSSAIVRNWLDDLNIARIITYERNSFQMRWNFVPLIFGMCKHFKLWGDKE